MKVETHKNRMFLSLNFGDVMWKPQIIVIKKWSNTLMPSGIKRVKLLFFGTWDLCTWIGFECSLKKSHRALQSQSDTKWTPHTSLTNLVNTIFPTSCFLVSSSNLSFLLAYNSFLLTQQQQNSKSTLGKIIFFIAWKLRSWYKQINQNFTHWKLVAKLQVEFLTS